MYDIVKDIGDRKHGNSLGRKDFNEVFSLYMIQRVLSMNSDINVEILNSTVNILYKTLSSEESYMFMMLMLPDSDKKRKYIKQQKKDKTKKDEVNLSLYFEEASSKIDDSLLYVNGEINNG